MLELTTLIREIRRITDPDYAQFDGWPESADAAADRWAAALDRYAAPLFPAVLPPARLSAQQLFRATYAAGLSQGNPLTLSVALRAYTGVLAAGLLPPYLGQPPLGALDLSPAYQVGLRGGSAPVCAGWLAGLIHAWFLTGTAFNTLSHSPVTWN